MVCAQCGEQFETSLGFCSRCGSRPAATTHATLPAGGRAETDTRAVASLILGIMGVTVLPFLAAIPAVILGHIARSRIRKSAGQLKGASLATAGLVMGHLSLAIGVFILIVFLANVWR